MEAKDKLITAKVRLQSENPFFSYLIMGLNLIEKKEFKTMGVNARGDLLYNPNFVNSLSNSEVKTVLAHEVMHVCLLHLSRENKRIHLIFNIACDIVVNGMLNKNGFDFGQLKTGCFIPNSNNEITIGNTVIQDTDKKIAEEIYEELTKITKEELKKIGGGFDEHIYSEDTDDKDGSGKAKEEEWKKRLVEAGSYAQMQGKLPLGLDRYIDKLLNSKLNWRELLYRFITNEIPTDYNYSFPHKRSRVLKTFLPSLKREVLEVSVAVDTSGSIDQQQLTEFLSEIVGISKSFERLKVNIMFVDTKINNHYVVENGNIDSILNWKISGGGGTDFKNVYDYISTEIPNTKLLVFFTDGYATFPDGEDYKTLWVLTKRNNKKGIPFGEVVEL